MMLCGQPEKLAASSIRALNVHETVNQRGLGRSLARYLYFCPAAECLPSQASVMADSWKFVYDVIIGYVLNRLAEEDSSSLLSRSLKAFSIDALNAWVISSSLWTVFELSRAGTRLSFDGVW